MKGALPPSSRVSFFTVSADARINSRPTSVEPVKLILRTSGFLVISTPMASGSPVITLRTPAGTPARSASTARARADNGVCSAGLTTMVHPAASAGDTLRVTMPEGKFHGVMAAHTPTGSLSTRKRRSRVGAGIRSP